MLRMGFAEDVDRILTDAPRRAADGAVLGHHAAGDPLRSPRKHLNDPIDIAVSRQSSTVDAVRQTYAIVPFRDKVDALTRVLQVAEGDATIVFVRTKDACDQVGADLIARGISAAAMNGDVPQKERERIIERLRDGRLDVLVATDVAARGLDVERVDLVVNFDAPGEPEAYVHRIGRTGRAGRAGNALTFFTPREIGRLRAIERATRNTLEQITPPGGGRAAHKATRVLEKADSSGSAGSAWRITGSRRSTFLAEQDLTAGELAATLLALAAGDDGNRATRAAAIRALQAGFDRADERPEPGGSAGAGRAAPAGRRGPRYRVAVGHTHGVRPAASSALSPAEGGLNGKDLGRIDIYDTYSLVEIGPELSRETVGSISRAVVSGQQLQIRRYHEDAGGGGSAHGPAGVHRAASPPGRAHGPFGPHQPAPAGPGALIYGRRCLVAARREQ